MKKRMKKALSLCMTLLILLASTGLAASEESMDKFFVEMTEKSEGADSWPAEASYIQWEQALEVGLRALLDLGWETQDTLASMERITFSFLKNEERCDWMMSLNATVEDTESPYTVKVDAITGTLKLIYVHYKDKITSSADDLNPDLEAVVSKWKDTILVGNPAGENSRAMPEDDDLPLESALYIAFDAVMNVQRASLDMLDDYEAYAEFHDYPHYGRYWEISLKLQPHTEGFTPLIVRISSPDGRIVQIADPSQG